MPNYSIDDIDNIKQHGFNFTLPKQTQDLIMQLSKLVGSPDYIKTPIFQKRRQNNEPSEPDWELFKQFKPTAKVERSDNEELIQLVKGALNKMTDKNYDEMQLEILENLEKLEGTNEYEIALDIIFNVASSNRFYSEVYARLYKVLMDTSSIIFKQRLQKEVDQYIERFSVIKNVNPNDDYEAFCDVNKENEQRKAMTEFFINLMKMDIISVDEMINITYQLCDLVTMLVDDSDNKHTMIELSDNIFIIMQNGAKTFNDADVYNEIITKIKPVTQLKVKEHAGLTNKAVFKFMDIIDIKL
jgi:hypothetical protein